MPTYDYVCNACGHGLEVFQSIHEPVLRKCPRCKKPKLERRIGPGAGILFKGSGFYQTDYRSESYKQGESSEKSDGKPEKSESKAEKNDGKPEKGDGKAKESTPAAETAKSPAAAPSKAKSKKKD
jgi:putative FmdB family regulatory protein